MAVKKRFSSAKAIVGIIVTLFFMLSFIPKLAGEFIEKGLPYFGEIGLSFVNWYDDSTAFALPAIAVAVLYLVDIKKKREA